MSIKPPFVNGTASLRVQTILYNNEPESIWRALLSMGRSVQLARTTKVLNHVEIALGDSSPFPVLDMKRLGEVAKELEELGVAKLDYYFFNQNLGTAGGHNRLLETATADLLLTENPDVVATPHLLEEMIEPLRLPGVGQVDARQLPIEHPKTYDPATRETSWATGACSLIPRSLFESVGRYDAGSFFLYCDDVDLSWRVRMAGYHVLFQPSATVFHDKRLSLQGKWTPSAAEIYYSAEAALILPHKWSRPDIVAENLRALSRSPEEPHQRAVKEFRTREQEGRLPTAIDPHHRVGQFIEGNYARHRFKL
jgi:GT2 family glycosyltransferase